MLIFDILLMTMTKNSLHSSPYRRRTPTSRRTFRPVRRHSLSTRVSLLFALCLLGRVLGGEPRLWVGLSKKGELWAFLTNGCPCERRTYD